MASENPKRRSLLWLLAFAGLGAPAFVLRFAGVTLEPQIAALILGMAIVGGAFLLSWAAEVAQMDVSASLAIAVLALIAILPEYTIEAVLAWDAGTSFDPSTREITDEMGRVAANVTGSNRLLIGVGWSVVILIFWVKCRRTLDLRGRLALEWPMLIVATLVTFTLFFMHQVHVVVAGLLIAMYLYYLWETSREPTEEPELMGPPLLIGSLPVAPRRAAVVLLFAYSATVILVAAEPFVESLVETGERLGINEFILIQWLAPLASEAPEIVVAVLFSLRANPVAGITTLVSAEVNQLTLLVGSMVIIFSISAGELLSFPLDPRQSAEFFLTSSVSALAIVLIAPRLLGWRTGLVLLGLFLAHLFFIEPDQRLIFAYVYLGMAAGLVVYHRHRLRQTRRK